MQHFWYRERFLLFVELSHYTEETNKYCAFPEDDDGIQMFFQDVTRYEDLGNVTRTCTADHSTSQNCTQFYFSKMEEAYFICPPGSEIREMKGYSVFHNMAAESDDK